VQRQFPSTVQRQFPSTVQRQFPSTVQRQFPSTMQRGAKVSSHAHISATVCGGPFGTTFNPETAELAEQNWFSLRVQRVLR
jgi:hypothetical protein